MSRAILEEYPSQIGPGGNIVRYKRDGECLKREALEGVYELMLPGPDDDRQSFHRENVLSACNRCQSRCGLIYD